MLLWFSSKLTLTLTRRALNMAAPLQNIHHRFRSQTGLCVAYVSHTKVWVGTANREVERHMKIQVFEEFKWFAWGIKPH